MQPRLKTHTYKRARASKHQSIPDEGSKINHSIELLDKLPDGQGAKMPCGFYNMGFGFTSWIKFVGCTNLS
jgi:hypothetical protein